MFYLKILWYKWWIWGQGTHLQSNCLSISLNRSFSPFFYNILVHLIIWGERIQGVRRTILCLFYSRISEIVFSNRRTILIFTQEVSFTSIFGARVNSFDKLDIHVLLYQLTPLLRISRYSTKRRYRHNGRQNA